jgi:hypothetical protein
MADSEGNFIGGVLAPGVELTIESFYLMTARLPRIRVEKPEKVIGKATIPAMHSGIFWGYVGLIESLIRRIRAEYGQPMKVVATGGLANVFKDEIGLFDAIEPDLMSPGTARDLAAQSRMTVPSNDELLFLALGGAGEIGMNLNLYGHAGKWLMVDLGIAFGDDTMPGVEVVMPDPPSSRSAQATSSASSSPMRHEDHLGAVADLWPRLEAPVYATPFAASVLKRKLREAGCSTPCRSPRSRSAASSAVGPFELEMITMTHSILEPNALAIRTKFGTVFHTGDWKIDPEPLLGEVTDEATCKRIGERVRSPWCATAPTCSSRARRARRRPCAPTSRSW